MIKIEIPAGVAAEVAGGRVRLTGRGVSLERTFSGVAIEKKENAIEIVAPSKRKVDKALAGTAEAHIRRMLRGLAKDYEARLQVVYSHFPVSIEVKPPGVLIKNFLGEKLPRKAAIVGKTKVEAKGANIVITGPDSEGVGQTAANIMSACRIRHKDRRVFQDGIYPVEVE